MADVSETSDELQPMSAEELEDGIAHLQEQLPKKLHSQLEALLKDLGMSLPT